MSRSVPSKDCRASSQELEAERDRRRKSSDFSLAANSCNGRAKAIDEGLTAAYIGKPKQTINAPQYGIFHGRRGTNR